MCVPVDEATLRPLHTEMVERVCGTPKEKFLQIAEMMASTSTPYAGDDDHVMRWVGPNIRPGRR